MGSLTSTTRKATMQFSRLFDDAVGEARKEPRGCSSGGSAGFYITPDISGGKGDAHRVSKKVLFEPKPIPLSVGSLYTADETKRRCALRRRYSPNSNRLEPTILIELSSDPPRPQKGYSCCDSSSHP